MGQVFWNLMQKIEGTEGYKVPAADFQCGFFSVAFQ
jgi:hypothetical protein